jgi:hypothetical protein
MLTETNL